VRGVQKNEGDVGSGNMGGKRRRKEEKEVEKRSKTFGAKMTGNWRKVKGSGEKRKGK